MIAMCVLYLMEKSRSGEVAIGGRGCHREIVSTRRSRDQEIAPTGSGGGRDQEIAPTGEQGSEEVAIRRSLLQGRCQGEVAIRRSLLQQCRDGECVRGCAKIAPSADVSPLGEEVAIGSRFYTKKSRSGDRSYRGGVRGRSRSGDRSYSSARW